VVQDPADDDVESRQRDLVAARRHAPHAVAVLPRVRLEHDEGLGRLDRRHVPGTRPHQHLNDAA
jgi:hypothetical protein